MKNASKVLTFFFLVITTVSCGKKNSSGTTSQTQTVEPGDDLLIHFFEMGQTYSDSFLIKYNNFEILVDGGNYSDGYTVAKEIGDYCTDGVLDMLIATHPHGDHTGGLSNNALYKDIKEIRTIVDYGYTYSTSTNRNYETIRNGYISNGASYYPIYDIFNSQIHNPKFDIGKDAFIEFLNTEGYLPVGTKKDGDFNHNSASVVAVLNYKNIKYYLGGDIEAEGEIKLRENYPTYFEGTYNIYKASHHGSNTSNGMYFVKDINPKVVLISAAIIDENRTDKGVIKTQHPYKAPLKTFAKYTDKVYWNGTSGSFTITINGVEMTKFEGKGRTINYYHNGEVVNADEEKNLPLPQTKWYEDYMQLK